MDVSLNARAWALADALAADAPALGVVVSLTEGGGRVIGCGQPGGIEAGLRLARVALAGLAEVALVPRPEGLAVTVRTSRPALACLGSQYAGWPLGGRLGSGPARLLARREPMLADLGHDEVADRAVLAIEGEAPDDALAAEVATACGVARDRLTLLHAPTGSLAGMTQVAARALECAMQKARHLGFGLDGVVEGVALAPLCAPHPDHGAAMGRANDAIIYGGHAHLFVTGPAIAARDLARALPSRTSTAWGRPFAEVLAEAQGDFAQVDAGFFAPAVVRVTALETGETFVAGEEDPARVHGAVEA